MPESVEAVETLGQDAAAVTAVRRGDAERYRELVERHERRVFAVAWSRLGDAALAEEATQEAFIRGYRKLWLLDDGAKFAGWIATLARNAAINLGLKHRRELNKRERWAMEQPGNSAPAAEATEICPSETLRQSLSELPDAHRECLVLFYLEGRSGAEAAKVQGISEAAFRVRLHRARAALREQLEEKLAGSLEELRPTRALVPAIMAAVLASSSAQAATTGAAVAGVLAKFAPVKWAFPFFSLLAALPALLVSWLLVRADLKNFRDQKGFRARLFRTGMIRQVFFIVLMIVVIFSLVPLVQRSYGLQGFYLVLAAFAFGTTVMLCRGITINRSRFYVTTSLAGLFIGAGALLVGLELLPPLAINFFILAQVVVTMRTVGERPLRMDYSLFLRAAEGMLPLMATDVGTGKPTVRLDQASLLAFGRFLGTRWLAIDIRWVEDGLRLRLAPAKWWLWGAMPLFRSWSGRSIVTLGWDGTVRAELGDKDEPMLRKLRQGELPSRSEMEDHVAAAVQSAWHRVRANDVVAAERALGQLPDESVFVRSPTRSGLARWRWAFVLVMLVVTVPIFTIAYFRPAWTSRMKPVMITESDARLFLGGIKLTTNRATNPPNAPAMALFGCLVLPSTNLFTADALIAMRAQVFRDSGLDAQATTQRKLFVLADSALLQRAMAGGWIGWTDLGLNPREIQEHLRREPNLSRGQKLLTKRETWSWVTEERTNATRITEFGLAQLRWLRGLNALDLVDRENLIREIASVQALSGDVAPGQPVLHSWRNVRGLFHTPNWPTLQDTYFSVAALEILGGLDRLDREACIRGILKHHKGGGFFASPSPGGYNEYKISGAAPDTFCAFETLRILGALDRVKDLAQWQFRTRKASAKAGEGVTPMPTWAEVEAFVCQQRLARFLRARAEDPLSLGRSLFEP